MEMFHSNKWGESVSAALHAVQDSFRELVSCTQGRVINTDKGLVSSTGSADTKLRMCVRGTGSDSQFMNRYFTGVLLCPVNRNPLKCRAALKHEHQRQNRWSEAKLWQLEADITLATVTLSYCTTLLVWFQSQRKKGKEIKVERGSSS